MMEIWYTFQSKNKIILLHWQISLLVLRKKCFFLLFFCLLTKQCLYLIYKFLDIRTKSETKQVRKAFFSIMMITFFVPEYCSTHQKTVNIMLFQLFCETVFLWQYLLQKNSISQYQIFRNIMLPYAFFLQ